MPLYNSEKWLLHSVRSLQLQSCGDWELLIVDDCSDDSSFAIAMALS
jgi:teichuronic acid biosynthesis glycosyltransferase TuaG